MRNWSDAEHSSSDRQSFSPDELIQTFARCQYFPEKDRLAQQLMAQGLVRAAEVTGIAAQDIVDKCALLSRFCPTDADFMTVAREMVAEITRLREQRAQDTWKQKWESKYGKPAKWKQGDTCLCCGRKWAEIEATARAKDRKMRDDITAKLGTRDWKDIGWLEIFLAQEACGYPLTPEQAKMIGR